MTATEYAAEVTELVQLAAGPDFEFPANFDADVAVYFQRRETPEAAAALMLGTDESTANREATTMTYQTEPRSTRTVDGPSQFCRGAIEHGLPGHKCTTYTTLHYGPEPVPGGVTSVQPWHFERRFHFCDEHPPLTTARR